MFNALAFRQSSHPGKFISGRLLGQVKSWQGEGETGGPEEVQPGTWSRGLENGSLPSNPDTGL